jgi:hypothetical protein
LVLELEQSPLLAIVLVAQPRFLFARRICLAGTWVPEEAREAADLSL